MQKKKQFGSSKVNEDNPFEMFVSSTQISYCYYKESERILGNTFGMLVLQDFEAITPNLLARTIETVEGGGIVAILLNTVDSLQQLYTLSMDVHDRYRTEGHQDIVPRFNERFILSLSTCDNCLVIDDRLNVLPITNSTIEPLPKPEDIDALSPQQLQLNETKQSFQDKQPLGALVNLCKTTDQLNALVSFVNALQEKTLKSTVSLTAGRGRGKSATLGLAIAAAIGHHYSNIYITSPSPENLRTLFEFVLKGFETINLKQHLDYELIYSLEENQSKTIVRINVFRDHRQTIQYLNPVEVAQNRLACQAADIVVIDEAAAIPLPIVKSFFGPYLVFLSSTINGYEGTGRSLSLKLLHQLRQQAATGGDFSNASAFSSSHTFGRKLAELTLDESIRYSPGDNVEKWLNHLLCLDASQVDQLTTSNLPLPQDCDLYYVNRDTLFSYHRVSETFLQRLVALYAASHYKNSPNDLQMMSDAPAHHLFCLLPPIREDKLAKPGSISGKIPEVLCFIQVALEGEISSQTIMNTLARGQRSSGDLIPWTISQQFQEDNFAQLSGARIVRIATNPNCNGKGYGTRALKLLEEYYRGMHGIDLNEDFNRIKSQSKKVGGNDGDEDDEETNENEANQIRKRPKTTLPPLLSKLSERKAEKLDYLGTSYGLTAQLLKFWKKNGFVPLYIRQTANELTGEHSCIMIKMIDYGEDHESKAKNWLTDFYFDFRKRFINLLGYQFANFRSSLALSILQNENVKIDHMIRPLDKTSLESHLSLYDLKRLEKYSQNLVDYHLIVDLLPAVARLYFQRKFMDEVSLSLAQSSILLSIGLQHKTVDQISKELDLPASQVLGLFIRTIARLTKHLRKIEEKSIEESLGLDKPSDEIRLLPLKERLQDELDEAAHELGDVNLKKTTDLGNLSQYSIRGTEDEWNQHLKGKSKSFLKVET